MGRPHRDLVAGGYYHVGSRGNDHAPIVVDREDRTVFFHLLRRVERRYGWCIHVSCLMGNHYHLVLETPAPNLDKGMRDLNGGYARALTSGTGEKITSSGAATGRSRSNPRSSTRPRSSTSSKILSITASSAGGKTGTGRRLPGSVR
jgi:REP element-mobilizing transposase RayT